MSAWGKGQMGRIPRPAGSHSKPERLICLYAQCQPHTRLIKGTGELVVYEKLIQQPLVKMMWNDRKCRRMEQETKTKKRRRKNLRENMECPFKRVTVNLNSNTFFSVNIHENHHLLVYIILWQVL